MANTWTTLLDAVYPIGSIYQAYNSTSPASRFGGTWSAIQDKFLLGIGDDYSTVTTGGEATHTLSVSEMPTHQHSTMEYANGRTGTAGGSADGLQWGFLTGTWSLYTGKQGGGRLTTICRLIRQFTFGIVPLKFHCSEGSDE